MIPSRFIHFDLFPLNTNGKVDRRLLLEQVNSRLEAKHLSYVLSIEQRFQDPVELEIAKAWRTLLYHDDFDGDDSFVDLGGTSIQAIQLLADLQQRGLAVSAEAFMRAPTINAVAASLRKHRVETLVDCDITRPSLKNLNTSGSSNHGGQKVKISEIAKCIEGTQNSLEHAYERVLLTGATGFVGIHVFRELLHTTPFHISCLVRGHGDISAQQRLSKIYSEYFPDEKIEMFPGRFKIISGDISRPNFGLEDSDYAELCHEIDAIYHLAADTRLFGARETLFRENLDSVSMVIDLAKACRPKDLHHMSTLAVAGENIAPQRAIFSERTLDIGQAFLNEYEASKYRAEKLVHNFVDQGGVGFIYRTGAVTGHSKTGRFQRNAGDNRLVQVMRAVMRVGELPRNISGEVSLSPVDLVAAGLVTLSTCSELPGNTFHIANPYKTSWNDLFKAIGEVSLPLGVSSANSLTELFQKHLGRSDPDIAVGYFWAQRPSRNVKYDHFLTMELLTKLGRPFSSLDQKWLKVFVRELFESGALGMPNKVIA